MRELPGKVRVEHRAVNEESNAIIQPVVFGDGTVTRLNKSCQNYRIANRQVRSYLVTVKPDTSTRDAHEEPI